MNWKDLKVNSTNLVLVKIYFYLVRSEKICYPYTRLTIVIQSAEILGQMLTQANNFSETTLESL